jgi:osmotically inducible protein OsmC
MPVRTAHAVWHGNLKDGKGTMSFGSFQGAYSAGSRFEEAKGTNPEELIGAAHAGCFSMALAHELAQKGYSPKGIETEARVKIEKAEDGFAITEVHLITKAEVPGLDDAVFKKTAEGAKSGCPVSKALTGVRISLDATLKK